MENRSNVEPVARTVSAFLVPLKSFSSSKERLGDALDVDDRHELMQQLAGGVLDAAAELDRWVVCDDDAVARFALDHGAQVVWRNGGLNHSVQGAIDQLRAEGYQRVVVSHGDLADPGTFAPFVVDGPQMVIAPDRHNDGSNVVSVPTDVGFEFSYGPGSLHRHVAEAARCGLVTSRLNTLSLDVDTPEDLEIYRQHQRIGSGS
ncbi:MAG: hypothetical protein HKN24_09165 [Acidimicrobiales bacterium]|nr:hypothetical protein [Acidimicrobiales bacterium]